jgi:hypothetical protein
VIYTLPREAQKASSDGQFIEMLKEQLDRLRIDFLTTLGEAELLKGLMSCESRWQTTIVKNYRETQDRSTKLLGKIKAAENLLQNCLGEVACS